MTHCQLPEARDWDLEGAPHVCIGDVVHIPVIISSHLPQPLTVKQCQLSLSVLQVCNLKIFKELHSSFLHRVGIKIFRLVVP